MFKAKNIIIAFMLISFLNNSTNLISHVQANVFGEEADLDCKKFIKGIIKELNMQDYNIRIYKMTDRAIKKFGYKNAFATFNDIYISQNYFKSLSDDVKRFLIGHELMHIKKKHGYKALFLMGTLGISSFIADHIILSYLDKRFPIKFNNQQRKTKLWQDTVEVLGSYICSTATKASFSAAIYLAIKAFSRYCEREADRESALILNASDGGIKLFEQWKENNNKDLYNKPKSKILRWFLSWLSTHPSHDERINLLKNLNNKQYINSYKLINKS